MPYRAQLDDHGVLVRYKDTDTGEVISAKEFERRQMTQYAGTTYPNTYGGGQLYHPATMASPYGAGVAPGMLGGGSGLVPAPPATPVGGYGGTAYGGAPSSPMGSYGGGVGGVGQMLGQMPGQMPPAMPGQMPGGVPGQMPGGMPGQMPAQPAGALSAGMPAPGQDLLAHSSLIQPGAQMLDGSAAPAGNAGGSAPPAQSLGGDAPATAGQEQQSKTLRFFSSPAHKIASTKGYHTHGFLDATSIAILLPTLVLLALIIAAAHKKRLFPWQTIRTFNPPSGLMTPRDYERSYICPPNLRRHGRLGKRNPSATWMDGDGIVLPFGFLARTHLPITIPLGRLPNKNMFFVAPSGSGKTTLMRAIIKALMAKPCVIVALEAKANDPTLDEKKESFKHTLLPEAQHAGFETLYFNPLDAESVHWNPLDLDPITFASSIVQDINSLPPEEQHWAERDHGYISGLAQLLKWGAVMVAGEDENGQAVDVQTLPCNPRGLMRLVNNRRNIVESLRRMKTNPNVPPAELGEMTQTLSSIIRTDSDWDKNIQGVRGRLRMFKNTNVLRCTESSNIDVKECMHRATVLIFGAPASMGPDAESLASCFVYQLQNAMHSRYGTASMMPLFAFFDEYQTLNMDIAGRLSAIVRGANGGLTIILQNIAQIAQIEGAISSSGVPHELKTIFSNSAIRVVLHNSDESTAKFFSEEIGKHAIIVPGISDHYDANGFGIFPTSWNRIHSQQVVARVDPDSIKRMEKHHALVYLSPAGDPEFGELKPFMCDLRGIEEIARLHLLHNVAGRNSGQPHLVGPEGEEGQPAPEGAAGAPAGTRIGNPLLARMMSPQALEKAAQLLGTGGGGGPQMPPSSGQGASAMGGPAGVPAGAPGYAAGGAPGYAPAAAHTGSAGFQPAPGLAGIANMAGNAVAHAAHATPGGVLPAAAAAVAGAAIGATAAAIAGAAARPPFPGGAQASPAAPLPGVAAPNPALAQGTAPGAAPAAARPAVPAQQPTGVPTGDRVCTKCAKWPGKGRFCIECGTFVGQPAPAAQPAAPSATQITVAAPGQARPAMPAPAQPVGAGQPMASAQPAAPAQPVAAQPAAPGMVPAYGPSGALGVPQRAPLTSLNPDMSKYGVPNAPAAQPAAPQGAAPQAAAPQGAAPQAGAPQRPAAPQPGTPGNQPAVPARPAVAQPADMQPGQTPMRRPQGRGGSIEF